MQPYLKRIAIAVVMALAALLLVATPSPAATHTVFVRDNYFSPSTLQIAVGDSVTWEWEADDHSVTSTDGTFDSDMRQRGASYTVKFDEPGTFMYFCELHGSAMSGTIQVGDGPPPPPPVEVTTLHVPSEFSTIEAAVEAAPEGAEVLVDEGTYALTAAVEIEKPLTITAGRPPVTDTSTRPARTRASGHVHGTTTTTTTPPPPLTADDVVIRADGRVSSAFIIRSPGVTIRTLSIEDFSDAGVRVEQPAGATGDIGYLVDDVHLANNMDYGIAAVGVSGRIEDVLVSGSRKAGISLRSCDPCGYIERAEATRNFVGIEILDGHGATVVDSAIHGNANGIVAQSREATTEGATIQLFANRILENDATDVGFPTVFQQEDVQPAAGAGVWLAGTHDAVVEGNEVGDQLYGIVATAFGSPTVRGRVSANALDANREADLAWDGVGAGLCFDGNGAASSSPPAIDTLYPCSGGPNIGIANPKPAADLALSALRTYYCRELGAC